MSHTSRRPIIVDCDPGIDDFLGLLVLLAEPSIRILAIITSMGNCNADSGFRNAHKVFANLVRHINAKPDVASHWPHLFEDRIILMKGATKPRGGDTIDASYFHGDDGMANIEQTNSELSPSTQEIDALYTSGVLARPDAADAPSLILSLFAAHPPRSIGLLTVGPLTTLAGCLERDRDLFLSHCPLVVSMGGALEVPGNTTAVAEFNVRCDAFALYECLRGGLGDAANTDGTPRWLLLPLDTTCQHMLDFSLYAQRIDRYFLTERPPAAPREPLVDFTTPVMRRYQQVINQFGEDAIQMHDPLAAWCMINFLGAKTDPPGWKTERRLFDVERYGELTQGMLVVDRRRKASQEQGRDRSDRPSRSPVQASYPKHGGPPPVQLQPSWVEVLVGTPGEAAMAEVQIKAFGPLSASVPLRR